MVMQVLQFLALCSAVCSHFQQHHPHIRRSKEANTVQVLIIGAGISGLEAARLLQQHGIKTLVLEARNRTGGRIWTMRSRSDHLMDTGASFIGGIYGSIPAGLLTNPIWDFVQEANIPTRSAEPRVSLGSYPTDDHITDVFGWYAEYMNFIRQETIVSSKDVSFGHYADLFAKQKNFTAQQHYALHNYLQFTIGSGEAAELDTISAKGFLDIISRHYGDEHLFHETGYKAIIDYLARNLVDIQFDRVVTKVNYSENLVQVSTRDGQIYQAEFVLITVPLGVLKSKQIQFVPPLPQWKLDVIDRIGFGVYEKVFLLWNQAWWNSTAFSYVRTPFESADFRYLTFGDTWYGKPTITCIFVGKAALQLQSKRNQNDVVLEIRSTLQQIFPNVVIPPPVETYMTNWGQDPFSYGSYSYISVEQNYEDPSYLALPVNNRLLFAGEATSTDTYGFTHGGLLSARREVTRLLFVYDLLSTQNSTISGSTRINSLEILIISTFIWFQLCSH